MPGASDWLQFERGAVAGGEAWRWLTAHLTHFDANHLAWDAAALVILGWLCERESRARTALTLFVSSFTITAAVALWQPQFATYRGLSGLDSALFGLLAINLLRRPERTPRLVALVTLVGFAAKCLLEISTDSTVFASGDTYAPVPLAHLVGLISGALVGAALRRDGLPSEPQKRSAI